jgi:hypothetical protein
LLIECCVEFITLVSSEANEISEKEAKKTIACDHITKALDTLGFGDYVPAVMEAAAQHKETQKVIKGIVSCPVFPLVEPITKGTFANREATNSRTAECRSRSWNDCRPSSLRRQRQDTTNICQLGNLNLYVRSEGMVGHGMAF